MPGLISAPVNLAAAGSEARLEVVGHNHALAVDAALCHDPTMHAAIVVSPDVQEGRLPRVRGCLLDMRHGAEDVPVEDRMPWAKAKRGTATETQTPK